MHKAELKIGRLVTIFIAAPFGMDDVAPFQMAIGKLLQEAPARVVTCMDLRASLILAPDVADQLIGLMRKDNPRIERTAMVLGDNAVLGLQVARMIREAGNPNRRTFQHAEAAEAWLGEALSPSEQAALNAFLNR